MNIHLNTVGAALVLVLSSGLVEAQTNSNNALTPGAPTGGAVGAATSPAGKSADGLEVKSNAQTAPAATSGGAAAAGNAGASGPAVGAAADPAGATADGLEVKGPGGDTPGGVTTTVQSSGGAADKGSLGITCADLASASEEQRAGLIYFIAGYQAALPASGTDTTETAQAGGGGGAAGAAPAPTASAAGGSSNAGSGAASAAVGTAVVGRTVSGGELADKAKAFFAIDLEKVDAGCQGNDTMDAGEVISAAQAQ